MISEETTMHILILIEPAGGGRFRATAGDPFGLSAEADSADEAALRLGTLLRDRLQKGSRLARLDLGNSSSATFPVPLQFAPLPEDDWFFQTMREAIAENRKREDEAKE
jgi:hypothetical protein